MFEVERIEHVQRPDTHLKRTRRWTIRESQL